MTLTASLIDRVVRESSKVLVGREREVKLLMIAIIADGHALVEGVPGTAKTLMAKTVARLLNLSFRRIQFTPDLLPADIVGTRVFDPSRGVFVVREGPIFANIVLADEINRASPRTQSALLEAMQEKQATIEGETRPLPDPFTVVATMNPIELEGVFPLPEAQLDRFLIKVSVNQPSRDEMKSLLLRGSWRIDEAFNSLRPVAGRDEVIACRSEIKEVRVEEPIVEYVTRICEASHNHPALRLGVTPRGALVLLRVAKVFALLNGRKYVIPDDVKAAALPALSHRLFLKPEFLAEGLRGEDVVEDLLNRVEVPKP